MSIISAGGAVTGSEEGFNPRDYFNTILYTGTGSSNARTGVGFQPDWVWIKERNASADHGLYDAVRGVQNQLESNTTTAETAEANGLTAFGTDGFTVGSLAQVNTNNDTYVAWNWKANGAGVTNTDGTITSTVSANTDSGFSIVTYTGTGANATVGHGLGVAPAMVIVKSRTTSESWPVYHTSLTNPATYKLTLSDTGAEATVSNYWNGGTTSTVFGIRGFGETGASGVNYVAYCFAEIADFSKIGSYTGNGSSTGPSVTTDFLPTFLMIKRSDSTGDWIIHDSARDATNPRTAFLEPNTADAEGSGLDVDFNSSGFQIKSSSATVNANGGTYVYICFA